jgi:alcohol dehydrogenase class IV
MLDITQPLHLITPSAIHLGNGTLQQLATHSTQLPTPIAILTGPTRPRHAPLWEQLNTHPSDQLVPLQIEGEPSDRTLAHLTQEARQHNCQSVIAYGGGSVLDAGKALAALLTNNQPLTTYLELIGDAQPLTQPPAPMIAIPTTSGTGAEATRNAVITIEEANLKVSLRHPNMIPDTVILDPLLTLSAPPSVTAASGLDALTQLLEAFVSQRAHPLTDALCRSGLSHLAEALHTAYHNGQHQQARAHMSYAALLSGIALTHVGLGSVHGLAGPLGGLLRAPHGEICATLLPHAIQTNLTALTHRAPQHPALAKYQEAAHLILQTAGATPHDLIDWLHQTLQDMQIPTLQQAGLSPSQFSTLIPHAQRATSMKGNPIPLTDDEINLLLELEATR